MVGDCLAKVADALGWTRGGRMNRGWRLRIGAVVELAEFGERRWSWGSWGKADEGIASDASERLWINIEEKWRWGVEMVD